MLACFVGAIMVAIAVYRNKSQDAYHTHNDTHARAFTRAHARTCIHARVRACARTNCVGRLDYEMV